MPRGGNRIFPSIYRSTLYIAIVGDEGLSRACLSSPVHARQGW